MGMFNRRRGARTTISITWSLIVLWAALGYFVYGSLAGVFAMLILGILYDLAMLLALIPFAGVVLQALVMYFLITPWVLDFTGIAATWLTTLVFWVDVAFGCLITFIMSMYVLAHLMD
jgi:hypothetical protein